MQSTFVIQSHGNFATKPAFRWLVGQDWIPANIVLGRLAIWQSQDGRINLAVVQPYGFDLATHLDYDVITTATDYAAIMRPVVIPPGKDFILKDGTSKLAMAYWRSANGNLFSISSENKRYVFDLDEMLMRDYCLDGSAYSTYRSSPDDKYVAWNEPEHDEQGIERYRYKGIFIMELS
ncbi:MAG: hypothetical protein QMD04_09835 [Anaerolineales bacterium]|nr:hypothetical protein [Anaerolineales bacterium]